MSHRTTSSLDDTIPLDKTACERGLSSSNQTYYGSDLSFSTGKDSKDSSVKIVYETINLTGSNIDNKGNQMVTLRFKK